MPKILCLDPGVAHTGLAVSLEGKLAQPLTTIFERNLTALVGRLTPFIVQINPDTIVIGQPSFGPLTSVAENLSEMLSKVYSGEVILFNEDLSSKTAQKIMREKGYSSAKIKSDEHQTAAALILQEFLDSKPPA